MEQLVAQIRRCRRFTINLFQTSSKAPLTSLARVSVVFKWPEGVRLLPVGREIRPSGRNVPSPHANHVPASTRSYTARASWLHVP